MLALSDLLREAASTGFQAEPLEKVIRLLGLLEGLRSHPFLKTRVALKGGTAINLFFSDVPRLSVDIDLNYIGAVDREGMLAERPGVDAAVGAVAGRLGFGIRRAPSDHAGGKWRLSCTTAAGRPGTLELDMNYMLRAPLWPPAAIDSRRVGSSGAARVPTLDIHEVAAGKLAALIARSAGRDLFDARELLRRTDIDRAKLRLAFTVYGGINRKDWREVSAEDIEADPGEVDRMLAPLLRAGAAPPRSEIGPWTRRLVADCRELLGAVLPLSPGEREFIDRLNGHGEIVPDLLSDDPGTRAVIGSHPGLKWKALHVRRRLGAPEAPPGEDEA